MKKKLSFSNLFGLESDKGGGRSALNLMKPRSLGDFSRNTTNFKSFGEHQPGLDVSELKLVFVGDKSVGKSCLIETQSEDFFNEDYDPSDDVFVSSATISYKDSRMYVNLFDTWGGIEERVDERKSYYDDTHVFVIVFSLSDRSSFRNGIDHYFSEIQSYLATSKKEEEKEEETEEGNNPWIVLVGNKLDIRTLDQEGKSNGFIRTYEGVKHAMKRKMNGYFEVSSKTRTGLFDIFQASSAMVMEDKNKKYFYANCVQLNSSEVKSSSSRNTSQSSVKQPHELQFLDNLLQKQIQEDQEEEEEEEKEINIVIPTTLDLNKEIRSWKKLKIRDVNQWMKQKEEEIRSQYEYEHIFPLQKLNDFIRLDIRKRLNRGDPLIFSGSQNITKKKILDTFSEIINSAIIEEESKVESSKNNNNEEDEEEGEEEEEEEDKIEEDFVILSNAYEKYDNSNSLRKYLEEMCHSKFSKMRDIFKKSIDTFTSSSSETSVNNFKSISCFYLGEFNKYFEPHGEGLLFSKYNRNFRKRRAYKSKFYTVVFYGNFKSGEINGRGLEFEYFPRTKINYNVFEGMFVNGLRDGQGEAHDLSGETAGSVHRGVWSNGIFTKDLSSFNCPIVPYGKIREHLKNSQILGTGAFGIVYQVKASVIKPFLGEHHNIPNSQKYFAVKVINIRTRSYLERQESFISIKRGIGLCSKLIDQSEHILQVYGILDGGNSVGYIMECCSNSIDTLISIASKDEKQQQQESSDNIDGSTDVIPMKQKISILYQTALGVKCMHKFNIIHRDLKWGNILINNEKVVKITDFDTLKEDQSEWRLRTVVPTENVGTMGFRSPESFLGQPVTISSDVYAFGIMIYCILWELNMPYLTQYKCSTCGMDMNQIFGGEKNARAGYLLDKHVANCNLRPLLMKNEVEKYPNFLIDLMIQCWNSNPLNRPTFKQIVKIFRSEEEKESKVFCYSVIQLEINFFVVDEKGDSNNMASQKKEKMLLTKAKLGVLKNWLVRKEYITESQDSETEIGFIHKNSGSSILEDEDLLRFVQLQERPLVILVEIKYDSTKEEDQEKILLFSSPSSDNNKDEKMMKISRTEYERMKERMEELEGELKRMKNGYTSTIESLQDLNQVVTYSNLEFMKKKKRKK